nr:integrase, catalytic region, zinc finger, CCHC-type, peptidase aspartic, catalytic [Tanacetum cinerariifolium]
MYKLDLEPLSPKLRKNMEAHVDYLKKSKEHADTLRDIVEQARAQQPLDSALDCACKFTTSIQVLLVYVIQIVLWYLDSGCSKHMTGQRSQLINFVSKFKGTVRFGNDHGFKHIREAFEKDVKTLKEFFHMSEQGLTNEITDTREVFNQMATEVDKYPVERKYFKIEKKELFIENDRLFEHIICQDVMCIAMHADLDNKCVVPTDDDNLAYAEMKQSFIDE